MPLQNEITTDVLVIGGGIAGCFAAIKAREQGLNVTLTDKGYAGKAGAGYASGMGYMVYNPDLGLDLDACVDAINVKGEYLNNREWTEIVFKIPGLLIKTFFRGEWNFPWRKIRSW